MSTQQTRASNSVRYRDRVLKARIDPQLPVRQVIKQLAAAFKTEEPAATLAIRDANDVLVTDENLTIKVMEGDDLKVIASPALEALDTISAMSYALQPLSPILPASPTRQTQPGLKLSLFKLHSYIKEEEFSHEFMLKGGMQLLVKLLSVTDETYQAEDASGVQEDNKISRVDQAVSPLTGNMLAYALQSFSAILELHIGWETIGPQCIRRLVHIVATGKTHNVSRPATEALSQLVGRVSETALLEKFTGKGKGRADDRQNDFRYLGIGPIFPAMRGAPGFLQSVVKRIDTSDLEMGSKSLELVNSLFGAAMADEVEWSFLIELERTRVNDVVKRTMSIYEHTDIKQHIFDFQKLYLRYLERKLRIPFVIQDPYHEGLAQTILDHAKEGRHPGAGPFDRQIDNTVQPQEDDITGISSATSTGVGLLAIDLLATAGSYPREFLKVIEALQDIDENSRVSLVVASFESARLLLSCFTNLMRSTAPSFQPMLLAFYRLHTLTLRLFLEIWQSSEADLDHIEQVCESTKFHVQNVLEQDPLMAWHTLEQRLLETRYETVLELQITAYADGKQLQQTLSIRDLTEELHQQSQNFVQAQRLDCMRAGTWFYAGLNLSKHELPDHMDVWRYAKLSPDLKTVQWGAFRERNDTNVSARLPEVLILSDVVEVRAQTSRPITQHTQTIPSQTSFSLMSVDGLSLLDLVAPSRDAYTEWMEGLALLFQSDRYHPDVTSVPDRLIKSLAKCSLDARLHNVPPRTSEGFDVEEQSLELAIPANVAFWYAP
ncbi:hypothetical protein FFLO_04946 [Filobasidium floriforme]|uniref:ELMO domain-containing protein n=1 Tax=Filobasidium floriforme TaxID=5210 RepID=A0A8K0JHS3_9TREE|nr:uncharacterized protein HD553DRAFT_309563 [Filobasidium floriforme]KAG7530583.1 hypothetical protein FFLO_04946 [Filobasidium floriforme]KAH8086398.1 hypothetical protein HD553DRAFT_309563 [Filobasidium floriforme]